MKVLTYLMWDWSLSMGQHSSECWNGACVILTLPCALSISDFRTTVRRQSLRRRNLLACHP